MRRAAFLICALTAMLSATSAQASHKLRLERLDLSRSPTVRTYLSYTDAEGRVLTGYDRTSFKIAVDSAPQAAATALQSFEESGEPIDLVIVVQVSQAMLDVSEDLKRAVKQLASSVSPRSKVALIAFAGETKRLAELGPPADAEVAANQLAMETEYVEVHLLDALRTSIDLLNAAPKDQRKLIVLFSDGIDVNMEKKTFLSIGKRAVEAGIVIDTIGYGPYEPARLRNLNDLTKQSNGGERTCKVGADIAGEFQNVADEIRKQYVATFELAIAGGDGKAYNFQVTGSTPGAQETPGEPTVIIDQSNTIIRPVPKGVHPSLLGGPGRRWWLWALCAVGGLFLIVLIVWLIFREKEEEPVMPMMAPRPGPEGPSRTQALSAQPTGGKVQAVGWLVGVTGRHAEKTFPLKSGGRTVIGTAPECDVVIDDGFASSRHAEVRLEGSAFRIVDLGSTNGLTVNDKKVKNHELVDNDLLVIGRTELKFKSVVQ